MTFGAPSVTSPSNYYCLRSGGGRELFRQRTFSPLTPRLHRIHVMLLLLSGKNQKHLYLFAYNSASLTKAAMGASSLRSGAGGNL